MFAGGRKALFWADILARVRSAREPPSNTILFIPLSGNDCNPDSDWAAAGGELIIRFCPTCLCDTIIGHGRRRKLEGHPGNSGPRRHLHNRDLYPRFNQTPERRFSKLSPRATIRHVRRWGSSRLLHQLSRQVRSSVRSAVLQYAREVRTCVRFICA
jgi:hypothetical protein